MDRNTITGIVLIALILISSTFFLQNPPEADKKDAAKVENKTRADKTVVVTIDSAAQASNDSLLAASLPAGWGNFTKGDNKIITIENEDVKVGVSAKGGKVSYIELKKYKTSNGEPVILMKEGTGKFGFRFTAGSTNVNTEDLYFNPVNVSPVSVTMAINVQGGQIIEQIYKLENKGYLLDYDLVLNGLNGVIPKGNKTIDLNWENGIIKNEPDSMIASHNATIHYLTTEGEHDYLSETSDDEDKLEDKVKWVSFKQQFFSQSLITNEPFTKVEIKSSASLHPQYLKDFTANLSMPYNHQALQKYDMQFYFGPLHYKTLNKMDLELERQIPLGWSFFLTSWVNRFLVIPVFNFLSQFIGNYGIIILLLTIFIKLIVLPLTYKSYLSTAKMRILKPELDELKAKYGDDMAQMQQEQMRLYRKAGVSPFGGCLPLLLQFPILIAMFRFFPASIELRQEGFLWAHDLSTWDSIYTLPFTIPYYGDHVSLFTILMTVSTLIYTHMNNSMTSQPPEFKWMSYLMPVFFLGFFNNYAAGLSLYYFYFNILTFLQQYLF
ncbi:MAG: membrane protein insertase YidC, partial [Bacteroidia bacterium]